LLAVQVGLVVLTLLAYARLADNGFINLDDPDYVTRNAHVQAGLSLDGLRWAFTTGHSANWHPLTWLSHMLDCQLWGLAPAGHHLTSLVLHAASVVLCFRFFSRTTEAIWPSAFVAAVFALHPLHVESVAWAAERKDVLAGLFWMFTSIAWVRWVERPSAWRYMLVLVVYALALMTKPMLVSLPFVLCLLDVWPLQRIHRAPVVRTDVARVVREKLPLFALALASSAVTYAVQASAGAMDLGQRYPVGLRLENALVAYVAYIGKALWPASLAVFYPHRATAFPLVQVLGAALLLSVISAFVLRRLRSKPYLAVGWLWYLGTLLPVIGIVQVGAQALADRYTYIPFIGLSIAVAWSAADVAQHWKAARPVLAASSALAVIAWTALTWELVGSWRNDISLFSHAVESLPESHRAHVMLGNVLVRDGRLEDGLAQYQRALELHPEDPEARINLARALEQLGRQDEALAQCRALIARSPTAADAFLMLARILEARGEREEAGRAYLEALRLGPDWAEAHNNYGSLLLHEGRVDEAITEFTRALELKPGMAAAKHNLKLAQESRRSVPAPR
jgi:tetratricopeptide (TPR) repeat protein